MWVFVCMHTHVHVDAVPSETRKGHWFPGRNYRQL